MLDLLLPDICPGCSALRRGPLGVLCASCQLEANPLPAGVGPQTEFHAVHPYDGPWRHALHRLKYERRLAWAGALGRELARSPLFEQPWTCVVAVPLHWRRWLWRGFNQVQVLLDVAAIHRPKLKDRIDVRILKRHRAGRPQQSQPAPTRREIVRGAFGVTSRGRARIQGGRILVVDDVVTTGATLSAAMATLRGAGASHVQALALLRTI